MEEWVDRILKEEKRRRNIPLEVKRLNGNYYLYHSTSKYDREVHGPRKVSEYIGRITESGVVEAHRSSRSVYEYFLKRHFAGQKMRIEDKDSKKLINDLEEGKNK